jgi:SAM-dependent methyltransferase
MAPEVVWNELPDSHAPIRVLDPMAGSGTTLATARLRGYEAIGFDRDPLAVLISRAWVADVDIDAFERKAEEVLQRAFIRAAEIDGESAFPHGADRETKAFIRYWFDKRNRIQLTALAATISQLRDPGLRDLMWCAMSRLVITKSVGVSRAMDVSHSRPHRSYKTAPVTTFERFPHAVRQVLKACPFTKGQRQRPRATVKFADARCLPLPPASVDFVITSPPYLNAIDYLRGHKFSLVWMGHSISELRNLRATNVGTEVGTKLSADPLANRALGAMCEVSKLSARHAGMLRRYVRDVREILTEVHRVLRPQGRAVVVVGNCNLRDTFVRNSRCIEVVAGGVGLRVTRLRKRPLPEDRRYLPPPSSSGAGKALRKRMREEVILTLIKK